MIPAPFPLVSRLGLALFTAVGVFWCYRVFSCYRVSRNGNERVETHAGNTSSVMRLPRQKGRVLWSALFESFVIAVGIFAFGFFCCFLFLPPLSSHSPDF